MKLTGPQIAQISEDLQAIDCHLQTAHCTDCALEFSEVLAMTCVALQNGIEREDLKSDLLRKACVLHLSHLEAALVAPTSRHDGDIYESVRYLSNLLDLLEDEAEERLQCS